jgi:hypothetical protein
VPPGGFLPSCRAVVMIPGPNHILLLGARDVDMEHIASYLPLLESEGFPVVDRTGLTGTFDFSINWAPASPSSASSAPDRSARQLRPHLRRRPPGTARTQAQARPRSHPHSRHRPRGGAFAELITRTVPGVVCGWSPNRQLDVRQYSTSNFRLGGDSGAIREKVGQGGRERIRTVRQARSLSVQPPGVTRVTQLFR